MEFQPYIENRNVTNRICNCGDDHEIKIIRGMLHYSEDGFAGFCAGLLEDKDSKHVWLSLITGEWPGTGQSDCYITADIWTNSEGRTMKIEDSRNSPFEPSEVFDSFPVSREQVIAVEGAKEWFIDTYLKLFEVDKEIGGYLTSA